MRSAEAELLLHAPIEPRALALAEHEGEQVEQRRVGVPERDGRPAQLERRALEGALAAGGRRRPRCGGSSGRARRTPLGRSAREGGLARP